MPPRYEKGWVVCPECQVSSFTTFDTKWPKDKEGRAEALCMFCDRKRRKAKQPKKSDQPRLFE